MEKKEQKYAWFLISLLWIFGFLGSIGRVIVQYYQQPITESLTVSRAYLGYAWSTSIFIGSICAPLGGWLIDKYGYKRTMFAGSILAVFSAMVVVVFPNPAGYFIGFGILGGLAGIGSTASYVIVSEWFVSHKAKALMIVGSAGSIGLAVITPVFIAHEHWMTWHKAFQLLLWISLAFTACILLFVKERKQTRAKRVESEDNQSSVITRRLSLRDLQNPVLWVVLFALFTCGFSMGTVEMHYMSIQHTAHVSKFMFTASISLLGVLELVGGFVFAVLMDRLPRASALSSLYLLRAIAFILLFVHLDFSPLLFSCLFGATYLGAIPGGILLANESLRTHSIGLQTGFFLFIHQLGGAVAAIFGGLNYDLFHDYQLLLALNILLSILSCIGYSYIRLRQKMMMQHKETIRGGSGTANGSADAGRFR